MRKLQYEILNEQSNSVEFVSANDPIQACRMVGWEPVDCLIHPMGEPYCYQLTNILTNINDGSMAGA